MCIRSPRVDSADNTLAGNVRNGVLSGPQNVALTDGYIQLYETKQLLVHLPVV